MESLSGRPAASAALARGATVREAAREAGVSPSTVTRWRRDPEFIALVEQLTVEAREGVAGLLAQAADSLADEAAASVRALCQLRDGADSPQVRRGAAKDILRLCMQLRDHAVLEHRVAELEQAFKVAKRMGP